MFLIKLFKSSIILFCMLIPGSLLADKMIFAPDMFVKPAFLATLGFYRVTRFELEILTGIAISLPADIAVVKLASLDDPETASDDDELTGYATDSGLNVMVYNRTPASIQVYGATNFEEKFSSPSGIDADEQGRIFVADENNNRVVFLSNDGNRIEPVNQVFLDGSPYDITHDQEGDLYVSVPDKGHIAKIEKTSITKRISDPAIKSPTGIKFISTNDKWNFYRSDFLAVINNKNEIITMTAEGRILKTNNLESFFKKEVSLQYLTIDYYANILVTDKKNNCIHKLDKDLKYIASFKKLEGEPALSRPKGIDIGRRFGQVFIVEKEGGRYYWTGIDVLQFKVLSGKDQFKVNYHCTDPFLITMDLFDEDDNVVKSIYKKKFIMDWQGEFIIDLLNNKGMKIPKGEYLLKCRIEPTYSSRTRFYKIIEREITLE